MRKLNKLVQWLRYSLSTLETIADFGDSRRFRWQSPNSATIVVSVDRALGISGSNRSRSKQIC